MRTVALKPVSVIVHLALLAVLAYSFDLTSSPVAILFAVLLGAFLGRIALFLVRRRRLAAPPVSVVPGGLAHPSDRPRRQRVTPAELPPPPGILHGRDDELAAMRAYLAGPPPEQGPRIISIFGAPGVGKTALAVSMAHEVAGDHPDGQLLIRFRDGEPTTVEESLEIFVYALKGPRDAVPDGRYQTWYRRHTARRRILVILDNVADPATISALLPVGGRCLAIVTSPGEAPDLGPCLRVKVPPLGTEAAMDLLNRVVGGDRVKDEPGPAGAIVAATAGYPMALHMVGAALAVRRNWTLDIAVRRMRDAALAGRGAGTVPFTASLDLAFGLLTEEEQEILLLLAVPSRRGPVEPWMVEALFEGAFGPRTLPSGAAAAFLERLVRARFVERRVDDETGLPAYDPPSYVDTYARSRLATRLSVTRRDRARRWLADERQRRTEGNVDLFLSRNVFQCLDDGHLDRALAAARESLALCRERAERLGEDDSGGILATEEGRTLVALGEVYAELGWIDEASACAGRARARGRQSPRTVVRARRLEGGLRRRQRQLVLADRELTGALKAVRDTDDRSEQVRVLCELTALAAVRGDLRTGEAYAEQARQLCDQMTAGIRPQLPVVLLAHARVLRAGREHDRAVGVLAEAERVLAEVEQARAGTDVGVVAGADRPAPAAPGGLRRPWIRLERALVLLDQGRYDLSRESALAALDGFDALRHRYGAAHARLALGRAQLAAGRVIRAIAVLQEGHATLRGCGDRWLEADAATVLAGAYARAGRSQDALPLLHAAQQVFIKLGDPAGTERASYLLWQVESSFPGPRRGPVLPAGGRLAPVRAGIDAIDAAVGASGWFGPGRGGFGSAPTRFATRSRSGTGRPGSGAASRASGASRAGR